MLAYGRPLKVLHVIVCLELGGAELMLKRLITSDQSNPQVRHSVISLTKLGIVGQQLRALGVEVNTLEMQSVLGFPFVIWQIVRIIRGSKVDIVQTWMYHGDLLGGLASRLAGNKNVFWGIRCSATPLRRFSANRLTVMLCAWLSRFIPSKIVCCAEAARTAHVAKGFCAEKMIVIPNGYDLSLFQNTPSLRSETRARFGIADNAVVIGIVGRFDALKDHRNFVRAVAIICKKYDNLKFLMVGRGISSSNKILQSWITVSGAQNHFLLAGERLDIPACLACMDVFCLSSTAEGFPNVICEAMAMNVPCVVTDVGDAASIVADTGIVVPPQDSVKLALAMETMIAKGACERQRLGNLARARIQEHYSIQTVASRFGRLYALVDTTRNLQYFDAGHDQ